MDFLRVSTTSKEAIHESFDKIATTLFVDYQLQVNHKFYRLIDIEFYYFVDDSADPDNSHKDIYAHKHPSQLNSCRWYFHDSGIDITFGNEDNHYGGILLRGIAKIEKANPHSDFIDYQIQGPLKVRAELTNNFNKVFDNSPNIFRLTEIASGKNENCMPVPAYIVKTNRINLNVDKDSRQQYLNRKYRYVILLDKYQFGYTNKTQIAKDLKMQYGLTNEKVNEILGSKFL